jgi:hypothetical protein
MERLLCRDICPLPRGCATEVTQCANCNISTTTRKRPVLSHEGKEIGEIEIKIEGVTPKGGIRISQNQTVCAGVEDSIKRMVVMPGGSTILGMADCKSAPESANWKINAVAVSSYKEKK